MEHIGQESINTKKTKTKTKKQQSGGKNVIKTRKTEKSCPINLSGKCVDMVADCSIVLYSTLRRQDFSSFLRQEEQIGYIKLNWTFWYF